MTATAAAIILSALILIGPLILRRNFVVVGIQGDSMWPTYRAGDRVLVRRRPIEAIRAGQIVVFEASADRRARQWTIKRAVAVSGDLVPVPLGALTTDSPRGVVPHRCLYVLGDNLEASYDSRYLGYVTADRLLGVVVRPLVRKLYGHPYTVHLIVLSGPNQNGGGGRMMKAFDRAGDLLLEFFAPKVEASAAPLHCGAWGAVCITCSGRCGARLYRFRPCWTAGGPVKTYCMSYSGCPC